MNYRFVINGQASEAHDEESIRKLIELHVIGADTQAWCEGMDAWKPASEIAELATLLGVEVKAAAVSPPPVPGQTQKATLPLAATPPLPGTEGPSEGLQSAAKKFVYWWFRPWNGRRSLVRDYIDRNPGQTVPVAAGLAVVLFLCVCLALSPFVSETGSSPQPGPNQMTGPAGPGAPGGGFNMRNWEIMRGAQAQTDQIIGDVYKYNRDSFDNQSETYRRANYDWYNPGSND